MLQLADAARKYKGVKWKHIGRTIFGLDCCGLILVSCRDLGYDFEEVTPYQRIPSGYDIVRECERYLVRGDRQEIVPNDVILFRQNVYPAHMGVIGQLNGQLSLIHAYAKVGRVVEEYFDPVWRDQMTHVFKLPEK